MQPIYTSRRGATGYSEPKSTFARNYNTVRLKKKGLGSISTTVVIIMLTVLFGLFYVSQGTRATSYYDYEISSVEAEITEMNAKKDDLAVEQARQNSIATAKSSTVAANMEDATPSGYVAAD